MNYQIIFFCLLYNPNRKNVNDTWISHIDLLDPLDPLDPYYIRLHLNFLLLSDLFFELHILKPWILYIFCCLIRNSTTFEINFVAQNQKYISNLVRRNMGGILYIFAVRFHSANLFRWLSWPYSLEYEIEYLIFVDLANWLNRVSVCHNQLCKFINRNQDIIFFFFAVCLRL